MNCPNRARVSRTWQTRMLLAVLCISSPLLGPATYGAQADQVISLKAQATRWLLQDASPNPPIRGWLDGLSMMIEQEKHVDAPVRITSTILPSGLVQVEARVGPNLFLWQVDYPKRKYYCMNKFTTDFMGLLAKAKPLR
jgi:hypothetical protein